ncbi:sensor domain-containing diguanylate cyclase [Lacisediminimonas sp.]|uniref:sensor domain-containing diguanylate cyclase n=1 Tax=Lacisediminimonas sp. TaxID=3060582 RepID=UPI00272CE30A|nr:sensor domain-containing diguanylate cyclase [Lacisediminimonas sp.]
MGSYIVWTLLAERQAIYQNERDRLTIQARVIAENLARQLEAASSALTSVSRDLEFIQAQKYGQQDMLNRRLQSLSDVMPGVRTMTVMDPSGTVIASNRTELVGLNLSAREYVRRVLQQTDPEVLHITPPFKTILGVFSINLLRVKVNAQGQLTNVVTATIDPDFFNILLDSVRYAPDMWTALAHGDGRLIIHLPQRPELLGADLNKPGSLFRRHMESGRRGTLLEGRLTTTGDDTMMAQRTIDPKALKMHRPLVVAVARKPSAIFENWRREALATMALWALLALISAAGLRYYQRHQRILLGLVMEQEKARRAAEEEIKKLAFYDPLTNLPNRRLLLDRLLQLQAASFRHQRHSALLFMDLDNFKSLNDTHGHNYGDLLLKQVAQRLVSCVREEDTVARLGGDEFVVMLCELDAQRAEADKQAQVICRKILQVVSQDYVFDDFTHHCNVSIGITLFGHQPEPEDDILKRADRAMYLAKAAGGSAFRMSHEYEYESATG